MTASTVSMRLRSKNRRGVRLQAVLAIVLGGDRKRIKLASQPHRNRTANGSQTDRNHNHNQIQNHSLMMVVTRRAGS